MANNFKNSTVVNIGTTDATIYTAPVGKKSIVIQFDVANISGTDVMVEAFVFKSNNSTKCRLIKNGTIPVGSTLELVSNGKKLILEAGDYIGVKSSIATSLDAFASILEDVS